MSNAKAPQRVVMRVPATTANLGPGFDALGMALSLYNRFDIERTPRDEGIVVETAGPGASLVPTGEDNLVVQGIQAVWDEADLPPYGWRIKLETEIPFGSGLGSSATAIVAGVAGANLLAGAPFDAGRLLKIATRLEGHPDNVAPAWLGGVTVVVQTAGGDLSWQRLDPPQLQIIVAVPERMLSTGSSRQRLPRTLPFEDAVFNVGRTGLLVAALAKGDLEALDAALDDRMHQPYRAQLVPGFSDVVEAAKREGALGAVLSGAGPSVAALAAPTADADSIGIAMAAAFLNTGVGAHWLILHPDEAGVIVEEEHTG